MMIVTNGVDQSPIQKEDAPLHEAFAVHMLNAEGIEKATDIAETFDEMLSVLQTVCPPGRAFSIVVTKLEEACFFAKKSMAQDPNNHKL